MFHTDGRQSYIPKAEGGTRDNYVLAENKNVGDKFSEKLMTAFVQGLSYFCFTFFVTFLMFFYCLGADENTCRLGLDVGPATFRSFIISVNSNFWRMRYLIFHRDFRCKFDDDAYFP